MSEGIGAEGAPHDSTPPPKGSAPQLPRLGDTEPEEPTLRMSAVEIKAAIAEGERK
jgi:hypothetical protein